MLLFGSTTIKAFMFPHLFWVLPHMFVHVCVNTFLFDLNLVEFSVAFQHLCVMFYSDSSSPSYFIQHSLCI